MPAGKQLNFNIRHVVSAQGGATGVPSGGLSNLELGRLNLRSAVRPMFGAQNGSYQRLNQSGHGSPASSTDDVRLPGRFECAGGSRVCCGSIVCVLVVVALSVSVSGGIRWSNQHKASSTLTSLTTRARFRTPPPPGRLNRTAVGNATWAIRKVRRSPPPAPLTMTVDDSPYPPSPAGVGTRLQGRLQPPPPPPGPPPPPPPPPGPPPPLPSPVPPPSVSPPPPPRPPPSVSPPRPSPRPSSPQSSPPPPHHRAARNRTAPTNRTRMRTARV